jgi:hypothetical protein
MKLNQEKYLEKLKLKFGDKFDYSKVEYKNYKSKIILSCKQHDKEFKTNASWLITGSTNPCPLCAGIIKGNVLKGRKNIKARKLTQDFIIQSKQKFGSKFDYSKTKHINNSTKIKIICPEHGEFKIFPWAHLMTKTGCPKCGHSGLNLTQKQFIEKVKKQYPQYDYSKVEYINNYTKIKVICALHGEFEKLPGSLLYIKTGCPKCGRIRSASSKVAHKWLDSFNNPQIIREYYIKELKIFVDGFDPVTNTVYEFDGDYWHGNPQFYKSEDINSKVKKKFGILYSSTLERHNKIKQLGYNLIKIWGSEFKQSERALHRSQYANGGNIYSHS